MANDAGPHITEEMRSAIGFESAPEIVEVDRTVVRRVAEALGDTNPLWSDEQYAKSTSFGGVIGFPVLLHPSVRSANLQDRFKNPFTGGGIPSGDEWEFLEPIRPGDTLAVIARIADFTESGGRRPMLFMTTEITYRNQHGRVVMIARRTTAHFAPKAAE